MVTPGAPTGPQTATTTGFRRVFAEAEETGRVAVPSKFDSATDRTTDRVSAKLLTVMIALSPFAHSKTPFASATAQMRPIGWGVNRSISSVRYATLASVMRTSTGDWDTWRTTSRTESTPHATSAQSERRLRSANLVGGPSIPTIVTEFRPT